MKAYMIYKVRNNKVNIDTIRCFKSLKKAENVQQKLNSQLEGYNVLDDRGNRKERYTIRTVNTE